MVYYDCIIFELASIRLGGQTCLEMESFDFIFILCFYFILEHEAIFFQPTFLKLWVIWIHVDLGIVINFKLLEFGCTCCFKKLLLEKLEAENLNGNRKTY
jgi:hypothetical protein